MIRKLRNEIKNSINKKCIFRFTAVSAVVLALLGTFLPGCLLVWQSEEKMNMVGAVPVEYYSPANLAVARNASANLGDYQKLQLITGRWESYVGQADANERTLENYEAVELAREQMDAFYQAGIYPTSLLSDYENWYSWEAEFCKVVDSTFNTYAAYYWKLSFVKYDGSEKHHVYMLENGTVFLAEAWDAKGIGRNTISKVSEVEVNLLLGTAEIKKQEMSADNQNLEEYLAFTDIETADLQWMVLLQWQADEQRYYVLQANSANRYLFSLQPVSE